MTTWEINDYLYIAKTMHWRDSIIQKRPSLLKDLVLCHAEMEAVLHGLFDEAYAPAREHLLSLQKHVLDMSAAGQGLFDPNGDVRNRGLVYEWASRNGCHHQLLAVWTALNTLSCKRIQVWEIVWSPYSSNVPSEVRRVKRPRLL